MSDLSGLRALVVEDEGSVAMLIESMLEDLGCQTAASVTTLAKALQAARSETFDFAVLDVNLRGEPSFPVAEVLKERGLPFVFSTGYGRLGLPDAFKAHEVLNKPFSMEELAHSVRSILNRDSLRQGS